MGAAVTAHDRGPEPSVDDYVVWLPRMIALAGVQTPCPTDFANPLLRVVLVSRQQKGGSRSCATYLT